MDKHFAALKIPDAQAEHKLTRTVSFSELPSSRRIFLEQSYESTKSGLVRQYSCEQIYDKTSNVKEVKVSEIVKTSDNEYQRIWKATVPYDNKLQKSTWNPCQSKSIMHPSNTSHSNSTTSQANIPEKSGLFLKPTILPSKLSKPTAKTLEKPLVKQNDTPITNSEVAELLKGTKNLGLNEKPTYQEVKKTLRPLVPPSAMDKTTKQRMGWICLCFTKILLPILIAIIAIITLESLNLIEIPVPDNSPTCNHHTNFQNATVELQKKIYGQDEAISSLTTYLAQSRPCVKLIALVGNSGVGKSYTIDILMQNFPSTEFTQYFSSLHAGIDVTKFSSMSCNLVILENLKKGDIVDMVKLGKKLSYMSEICITVVAVFNFQEHSDNSGRQNSGSNTATLANYFKEQGVKIEVINYKPLSQEALEKCILDAAKVSKLMLSARQISEIKNSLLSFQSGCKRAHSQVQIIGRL